MLRAYTLDECLRAEKALQEWLRAHPQDWTMYDLVSELATVKAAALEEAQKKEAPQKTTA